MQNVAAAVISPLDGQQIKSTVYTYTWSRTHIVYDLYRVIVFYFIGCFNGGGGL